VDLLLVLSEMQSRMTQGKRCSCSSAYLSLFKGGMRSPSWLHSTPCRGRCFCL